MSPFEISGGGTRVLELRENQYAVKVGGPPPAGKFTKAQLNAVFTTEGGNADSQSGFVITNVAIRSGYIPATRARFCEVAARR